MCKLFIVTNGSKLDIKKLSVSVNKHISKIEKDGFGMMLYSENGVYTERSTVSEYNLLAKVSPIPFCYTTRDSTGSIGENIGPIVFHGRTSTNKLGLENTHPITVKKHSICHNGVVSLDNKKIKLKLTTDNDSELIAHLMNESISLLTKSLTGYYAFASINHDTGDLTVVRDKIATLYAVWIESASTYLMATTESILDSVCYDLDLEYSDIQQMLDDSYIVFDKNGTLVKNEEITSRGYDSKQAKYASKSLGRSLDESDFDSKYKSYKYSESIMDYIDYSDSYGYESEDDLEYYFQGERISYVNYLKLDDISRQTVTVKKPSKVG